VNIIANAGWCHPIQVAAAATLLADTKAQDEHAQMN